MRIVEVVADRKHAKTLTGMARFYGAEDHWWAGEGPDGRIAIRMVVPDEKRTTKMPATSVTEPPPFSASSGLRRQVF